MCETEIQRERGLSEKESVCVRLSLGVRTFDEETKILSSTNF